MTLDIGFQIASVVFVVLLAGVGLEMANNPPICKSQKNKYRLTFIIIGGLLIAVNYRQAVRNAEQLNTTQAKDIAQQQRTEAQYNQVRGQLDNITQFVAHPPPNFTSGQVASAVQAMSAPRLHADSADPFFEYRDDQFIDEGRRELVAKMEPMISEWKDAHKWGQPSPSAGALSRSMYYNFMDCCSALAEMYRLDAHRRIGDIPSRVEKAVYESMPTLANGGPEEIYNEGPANIQRILDNTKALINQLSQKNHLKLEYPDIDKPL
jgi:hypothetical protein